MNLSPTDIVKALKRVGIIACVYLILSLITGALLAGRGIAPFGVGFIATALWMGALGAIWWRFRDEL